MAEMERQASKKLSKRQRWKKTALHNQLLVIGALIAALAAIIYTVTAIVQAFITEQHRKEDRRPVVIHNRPPRFLQPVTCDPDREGGGFTFSNMEISVKNVLTDTAEQVYPYMFQMKVIPLHKTGVRSWDEPLIANCGITLKTNPLMFSLIPGEEKSIQIRQGVMGLPPLKNGETVQLQRVDCVYYADRYGKQHASCDSYRFYVPSNNPLDRIFGTPTFDCDGIPKNGTFQQTPNGSCSN